MNKTSKTTTQKLWGNEAKDDPLTPLTHVTPIKNNKESYSKKLTMKRKPPLEEPLIATPTSKGKKE